MTTQTLTVTALDKKLVKEIGDALRDAVKGVHEKYGLKLTKDRISYDANGFRWNTEVVLASKKADVDAEKARINVECYAPFGLKVGSVIHSLFTKGRTATVVDANRGGGVIVKADGKEGLRLIRKTHYIAWTFNGKTLDKLTYEDAQPAQQAETPAQEGR